MFNHYFNQKRKIFVIIYHPPKAKTIKLNVYTKFVQFSRGIACENCSILANFFYADILDKGKRSISWNGQEQLHHTITHWAILGHGPKSRPDLSCVHNRLKLVYTNDGSLASFPLSPRENAGLDGWFAIVGSGSLLPTENLHIDAMDWAFADYTKDKKEKVTRKWKISWLFSKTDGK